MQCVVMDADKQTAWLFSRLLYEKHIYNALSDEYKDVYKAHELLQEIEFGYRTVLGFFDDTDNFTGCVHGVLEDGIFTCHLLFKRKVNVLPLLFVCEETFKNYCREKNLPFEYIDGFIDPKNIAAVRVARRFGSVYLGKKDDVTVLHGNTKTPCLHYRKEIK